MTYSIPEESIVLLALFDLTGKKVKDIVDSRQARGTHVLNTDLSGLNAGMYLCRLVSGGESAVIRVAVE
jgi:hypothetical protein